MSLESHKGVTGMSANSAKDEIVNLHGEIITHGEMDRIEEHGKQWKGPGG